MAFTVRKISQESEFLNLTLETGFCGAISIFPTHARLFKNVKKKIYIYIEGDKTVSQLSVVQ